jgi:hypothetical protein
MNSHWPNQSVILAMFALLVACVNAELICHFFSEAGCPLFSDLPLSFVSVHHHSAGQKRTCSSAGGSGREAARLFAAGGARYLP